MKNKILRVTKRNGKTEPLDLNKIHQVVEYACEGLSGVSASQVELKSQLQFYDKISTCEIQETLIKAASDLISEETPNYQFVAGRLVNYHLRKQVYDSYEPWILYDLYKTNLKRGLYTEELDQLYDQQEWKQLNEIIDHQRDLLIAYAGMEQYRRKYAIQNRATNQIYETPQITYILIAATLFSQYPKLTRMAWIKQYYDAISQHYISLPTPIMAGVRSPQKQFSSCTLIEAGDDLDSINATASAIVKYVSQKAGIGIGFSSIRAVKSPIRNGDAYHTGIIPFIKYMEAATRSCSQGSVRTGAGNLNFPFWHYEVENLIVLKNNKGTNETRARNLDYTIQLNGVFYKRFVQDGQISLFSPHDVPHLFNSFYSGDLSEFEQEYLKAETNPKLRKKVVSARQLMFDIVQERVDTGRLYIMNIDNVNKYGSFKSQAAPVRMTNLCVEITLPTQPFFDVHSDDVGEIALCTLSAINWGKIKNNQQFVHYGELCVRALDALLDYQYYPVKVAEKATKARRPLGVGIINFAYWLAKNGYKYSDFTKADDLTNSAVRDLHVACQWWSYGLLAASVKLAKEFGRCPQFEQTKYSDGWLPFDGREVQLDDSQLPPWNQLRNDLIQHGIRNSTLMALMPSETSSQVANATNGIEPIRSLVVSKRSQDGTLPQVAPDIKKLKNKYETLWQMPSPEGYLNIATIIQQYVDQAISVNTSYNPENYPEGKLPISNIIADILIFYVSGGKNLYYNNVNDLAGQTLDQSDQEKLEDQLEDQSCDSCVL